MPGYHSVIIPCAPPLDRHPGLSGAGLLVDLLEYANQSVLRDLHKDWVTGKQLTVPCLIYLTAKAKCAARLSGSLPALTAGLSVPIG